VFADRVDAGKQLAAALKEYRAMPGAIVLGIPRGGVVVAAEVASALGLPLDIVVAAKVGAPGNPEYAIGAVAPDGEVTANPTAGYAADEVKRLSGDAHAKVERYVALLRGGREAPALAGRTVLLVDDGLATGLTALAAVEWLRREGAATVVVAVPVASSSAVRALCAVADNVVSVAVPRDFYAVGQHYERFGQTEDAEVLSLLRAR